MRITYADMMRIMRRRRFAGRRRDRTAAKRATNVSIRADLLDAAREAGVNLSATLERALADELSRVRRVTDDEVA